MTDKTDKGPWDLLSHERKRLLANKNSQDSYSEGYEDGVLAERREANVSQELTSARSVLGGVEVSVKDMNGILIATAVKGGELLHWAYGKGEPALFHWLAYKIGLCEMPHTEVANAPKPAVSNIAHDWDDQGPPMCRKCGQHDDGRARDFFCPVDN